MGKYKYQVWSGMEGWRRIHTYDLEVKGLKQNKFTDFFKVESYISEDGWCIWVHLHNMESFVSCTLLRYKKSITAMWTIKSQRKRKLFRYQVLPYKIVPDMLN